MTTPTIPAAELPRATFAAEALAAAVPNYIDVPAPFVPLSDGGTLQVRLVPDEHTTIDDGNIGTFQGDGYRDVNTGRPRRPPSFDGGAVKLRTRHGAVWFQPAPDWTPDERAGIIERARAYFLEHWHYVGVEVTRTSAPFAGPFGEQTATASEAIYGMESDDRDHLADLVAELAAELGTFPKETTE